VGAGGSYTFAEPRLTTLVHAVVDPLGHWSARWTCKPGWSKRRQRCGSRS